jgi:CBS domain-containing protein
MTPDPCGVDERLRLGDALDRMIANNIRHLVVLRGARLAGVVALDDLYIAASIAGDDADEELVTSAVRPAFMCSPDTPVAEVARQMEARRCDCAVVVDPEATVVGIFTITDALRALRQLDEGHIVEPEVMPSHNRAPYETRAHHPLPSTVRASRLVESAGASPSAGHGITFGKVFP